MTHYSRKKTYWKNKCDSVFSQIVKLRDGKCQETNTTDKLQCAHIISRIYHAVRWDFDNALALSFKRHMYYTHHPVEWRRFIREHFGKGYYEMLEKRALKYKKMTLKDYKELYEELNAKLEALPSHSSK